ncbi:unnamed protein product, partial [Brenthis ino]
MNKLLVVLLAVCLVSVHAFVKRDAETPQNENYVEKYRKDLEDISKNIGTKIQDAFNPEQIKKGLNDLIDGINKAFNEIKPKEEVKQ